MQPRRGQGEGNVRKRDNGRWEGQVRLGGVRRSVSGATKREVLARIRELRDAAEKGTVAQVGTAKATVADAIAAHRTRLDARVSAGTLKGSTRDWWVAMLKHSAPLFESKLSGLTQANIERWISGLAGSGSLRRGAFLALKAALDTARRNGLTTRDPFIGLTAPSGARESEPMHATEDDVTALLATAPEPWRAMFVVLAYTGLRRGELLALTWEDVDLSHRVLRVREGKTATARRTVPMAQPVVDALSDPGRGLIFPAPDGGLRDPRGFNRAFTRYAPEGLTPHGLRHGLATRLLEAGVSVHIVSAILGHASVSVTMNTYAHSVSEAERAAVDLL